ncbi:ComEC/Rec2 family competence protein [Methyloligella solikamskensis]|uniref:ComEC/Rec2 family competence protein n=1 Tax=Methyloligella solikamskensis TaxID=1177756 RepID=A0ABW3JCU7_9HYPH
MVYAPDDRVRDEFAPRYVRLRIASALAALATAVEAQWERKLLWLPVFFACGILLYFSLRTEPGLLQSLSLAGTAGALLFVFRRNAFALASLAALLSASAGFAAAKLHTELARAPVITQETDFAHLSGWIEEVEHRHGQRDRLLLRLFAMEKRSASETPYRVRISVNKTFTETLRTGDALQLWATLLPPPEPAEPGGFDFGRKAWFMGLGAVGYGTSRITLLEDAPRPPASIRLWVGIDRIRSAINARIDASLPGEEGGLAKALITGDRGGVSDEVQQAMRDSGLAHILSISGLHMMLMAGTVFWAVRALLAFLPAIALRFPIKKWAAVAALAAALFYLAISGAALPTIRAWIMMSIVLLAVILDRPAITMRNVALAALAILIVAPESVFDPSFEMSFAAVIALVAMYEAMAGRKRPQAQDVSRTWRILRYGWLAIWATAVTTTIAGLATAPFAAYHFHRVAYYGLAANLLAAPIVALVVMPMALLSVVAMPFHLEHLPLLLMGYGLDAMVWVGTTVASWPGAISIVPSMSGVSLVLIVAGGLWLCLWHGTLRQAGWAAIALGLFAAGAAPRPDLLIEREGEAMAVRGEDGRLALLPDSHKNYSVHKWLEADGDAREASEAAKNDAFSCDSLGCLTALAKHPVAFLTSPGAAEEDCRHAQILIAKFYVPRSCTRPPILVDRRSLKERGAHALYLDEETIRIETVAQARGNRPWAVTTRATESAAAKTAAIVKISRK